jgi:hypothetical protein
MIKKHFLIIYIGSILFGACSPKMATKKMSDFDLFKTYIVGDFDNADQVAAEQKAGKQIHPFAKHVNRLADGKIKNLPPQYRGFYVLEESYYDYPNKPTEVKPYLFWFEPTGTGAVRLHSLQLPPNLDKKEVRNDNPNLSFDYNALKESPTFAPATYTRVVNGFYLNHTVNLPNGMSFTLEETIGDTFLTVMESLKKDGKLLTPYDTPLLYKRK